MADVITGASAAASTAATITIITLTTTDVADALVRQGALHDPSLRMEKHSETIASERRARKDLDAERYAVAATADSHFSWIRTRLAAESTLMGWIRLATTLIGFGFTIVQFFDRFGKMESVKAAIAPNLPRYMGLTLLSSGIVGLLIAIRQYVRLVDYLHSAAFEPIAFQSRLPGPRATLAVAVLLVMIGIVALVSLLFRLS